MKRINIIVVEHDGMYERSFSIPIDILSDSFAFDIRKAVIAASTEYVQTPEGKELYDYNCGCFNWADFEAEMPNEICEKYGFKKVYNSNEEEIFVDWDEHLVNDFEIDEEDE